MGPPALPLLEAALGEGAQNTDDGERDRYQVRADQDVDDDRRDQHPGDRLPLSAMHRATLLGLHPQCSKDRHDQEEEQRAEDHFVFVDLISLHTCPLRV